MRYIKNKSYSIKENISGYVTVKKGAPACNHMKYGCQMQNNLLYKDDEYLR